MLVSVMRKGIRSTVWHASQMLNLVVWHMGQEGAGSNTALEQNDSKEYMKNRLEIPVCLILAE